LRHRPVLVALGGLGAVLTAAILAELVSNLDGTPPAESEPAAAGEVAAGSPAAAGNTTDWNAVLLARPPFNPRRRPDPVAAEAASTSVQAPADLPRLAGIVISRDGKRAIFQAADGEKPIVVTEGEDVAGWTVQLIAGGGVTVVGHGGSQILEPKFDPNAKAPESVIPGRPPIPPNIPPTGSEVPQSPQPPAGGPVRPYPRALPQGFVPPGGRAVFPQAGGRR
jgi:hypothetical protein